MAAHDARPWPALGRKEVCFLFWPPEYVFIITYKSISESDLYQTVWWQVSSTVELLHGGPPAPAVFPELEPSQTFPHYVKTVCSNGAFFRGGWHYSRPYSSVLGLQHSSRPYK